MTKKLFALALLVAALLILQAGLASACQISVTVNEAALASYKVGAEVVLKVVVVKTHRTCTTPIEATKLIPKGLEILGATDWKQTGTMTYERLVKVKITGAVGTEAQLTATRTCDKEDSAGVIKLKIAK